MGLTLGEVKVVVSSLHILSCWFAFVDVRGMWSEDVLNAHFIALR